MLKKLRSKLTKKHAIAGAILLALAFGFGGWGISGWDENGINGEGTNGTEGTEDEDVLIFRHPLSGLSAPSALLSSAGSGDPAYTALPRVYAVMIDNSVDAWPASGIDKAFLVIEAPVEAAIPRFEAFFASDIEVEKIGPVRSARPYFVDWANEFDALYAHVGGSNAALDLIAVTGTFDLNEYAFGGSFWRASGRYAPHNVYTSTELLAEAVEKAKERGRAPEVLYGMWGFKDGTEGANGTEGTKDVEIRYNSDLYTVRWEYDEAAGTYLRSQGGREAKTADGVRLTADNVAVIVTDIEILDAVGRRAVRTTGEGKAWLLQDGKTIEAIWKKPSASERLAFYDANGNVLAMNAGNTWIEVVEDESDITM